MEPAGEQADGHGIRAVSAALDGRVARPVARNFTALAGSQSLTIVLHFAAFAVLASRLGPGRLGTYVFAVAVPDLLRPVVDFGFKATVTREVSQDPGHERALVPNLFYARAALGAVCYGAAALLLAPLGYGGADRAGALVAGVIVLLVALESFQVVLEVRLRMGWVAVAGLAESVALVAGVAVLAHGHAGVAAFLWLYVAVNALSLGIVAGRALPLGRFDWRPVTRLWWPVARAAAPLGAAALLTALYYRLGVFILARAHSPDAVGQYGAGYRFLDTVSVFPGLLMAVLNPVLARSVVAGRAVLRRRYEAVVHLGSVVAVGVGVIGAMTAWRVLPHVRGFRQYHGAGVVLSILAPAAGLIVIGTVLSGVLFSAHRQRLILAVAAAVLALDVGLDVALIPPLSYVGAAVATTAGEAASTVALAVAVRRRLGLGWPRARLRRVVAAGAASAVVLLAGYALDPFAQAAAGVLGYLVALVLTGALTRADLAGFRRGATPDAEPALAPVPALAARR